MKFIACDGSLHIYIKKTTSGLKECCEGRKMEPEQETKVDIAELKEHVYDIAGSGIQADRYTKTTKAIGQYVGRVYGREMKTLVLQLSEAGPTAPEYPMAGDEQAKAIWSKEYDQFVKKREKYADYKSKVFTTIMGQCTKAMRNRVEAEDQYESAENDSDVIVLLGVIKDLAFSASDLKYPHMRAAQAWKDLVLARQQEHEDIVDYYRRFENLVEITDAMYGKVTPVTIAEKDKRYTRNKDKVLEQEREKFLAFIFMDGADKKVFGYLMKSLRNDFTLGNDKYPVTMEDALQVLAMNLPRKKADGKSGDAGGKETSFNQTDSTNLRCWYCKEAGHVKQDCPKRKKNMKEKEESEGNDSKDTTGESYVNRRVTWSG